MFYRPNFNPHFLSARLKFTPSKIRAPFSFISRNEIKITRPYTEGSSGLEDVLSSDKPDLKSAKVSKLIKKLKRIRSVSPVVPLKHSIDFKEDCTLSPISYSMSIELNPKEKELCSLLTSVTKFITSNNPALKVQLRFAGGWVRDKLLGMESNDIDVAIDTMTGSQFFGYLRKYEETHGKEILSKGTTILANPEKSKHLETVTASILDLEIDFVNLRSEKYTQDSRVPEMAFGTPEEDAFRRDITINSLFYNIHTEKVEDFCKKGLTDLKFKLIRTPLPPLKTFVDDPLRVLRCIRFANRLGFDIAPEVIQAMSDGEIKAAFKAKISRERVGTELSKMISGGKALQAFELIHQCGLYETIFFPNPLREEDNQIAPPSVGIENARVMTCLLDSLDRRQELTLPGPIIIPVPALVDFGISNICDKGLLLLTSFLVPFKDVVYISPKNNRKVHSIMTLVKDTIKFPLTKGASMEAYFSLSARLSKILIEGPNSWTRSSIGLFIHAAGPNFSESVLVWLVEQIYRNSTQLDSNEVLKNSIQTLQLLFAFVNEKGLHSVRNLQPLLTGKQIAQALGIKPGVIVGYLKHEAFVWQLEHPQGTLDECIEWLKMNYSSEESRNLLQGQQ